MIKKYEGKELLKLYNCINSYFSKRIHNFLDEIIKIVEFLKEELILRCFVSEEKRFYY